MAIIHFSHCGEVPVSGVSTVLKLFSMCPCNKDDLFIWIKQLYTD